MKKAARHFFLIELQHVDHFMLSTFKNPVAAEIEAKRVGGKVVYVREVLPKRKRSK